nr:immunoglobulin heavy chain junction region [Macaca mulatta]MOW88581.1 immunoglobulin heavy chain junction region [Macaca mulatta]MOW88583.1 immunoglobulin heavy chain junction region [Macaca mulatta]MOW89500.1 immunoglobulin heavy chain junction region [Macaca mulatta]MOW90513.1 immunoglobulin heavy chain junction region [Macaca mulatta]
CTRAGRGLQYYGLDSW